MSVQLPSTACDSSTGSFTYKRKVGKELCNYRGISIENISYYDAISLTWTGPQHRQILEKILERLLTTKLLYLDSS